MTEVKGLTQYLRSPERHRVMRPNARLGRAMPYKMWYSVYETRLVQYLQNVYVRQCIIISILQMKIRLTVHRT